jgi:hypothetical protein
LSNCSDLQEKAERYLIINPAVMQILTELMRSSQQVQQSVVRAAFSCGCIQLDGKSPELDAECSWDDLKKRFTDDKLEAVCGDCRAMIKDRLGSVIFYVAALANAFGFSLDEIIEKENCRLDVLGYFMLL